MPDEDVVPGCPCPHCGEVLDRATAVFSNGQTKRAANPGDVTVCIKCAKPLRFGPSLTLHAIGPAQFAKLPALYQRQLRTIMYFVQSFNRMKTQLKLRRN